MRSTAEATVEVSPGHPTARCRRREQKWRSPIAGSVPASDLGVGQTPRSGSTLNNTYKWLIHELFRIDKS